MSSQSEINIIKELSEGKYKNSVIFTFNSSLPFYESVLLPRFWSTGCRNNLVVMDSRQYEIAVTSQSDNIHACGNVYTCDRIESLGAFHSKIIFLSNEKSGRLFIGSGNNTVQGYTKNNELFYKFDYSFDNEENLEIFKEVFGYIKKIVAKSSSPVSTKRLEYLESSTPWLMRNAASSDEKFLHNLEIPLLEQIIALLGEDNPVKIVLSSPYFDKNLTTLKWIIDKYPSARIELLLQNEASSNFPLGVFNSSTEYFRNVKIKLLKDNGRFYHAKYIYFEGNTKSLFAGSPNLSQMALLKKSDDGNYETGVFISSKELDASYLWDNKSEELRDNIIPNPSFTEIETTETIVQEKPLKITDAYLKDGLLYIKYLSKDEAFDILINGKKYEGKYSKENGYLILDQFTADTSLKISLASETSTSNTLIANNNHFQLFEDISAATRDVRSIYSVLQEDSIGIYSIFAFSPNLKLRQGNLSAINTSFRDSVDQEEENQKVLSPDKFYVEENKEFYSRQNNGQAFCNESNESILFFINLIARSFNSLHKSKNTGVTTEHQSESKDSEKEELVIDYNVKFRSLIKRKYDSIAANIDQTELDYLKTMNLMSVLAILVRSYRGIPTKDERFPMLNISLENFAEYTVHILSRMYLDKLDSDILNSEEKGDLRAINASMLNLLAFSSAIYILSLTAKHPERIEGLPKMTDTLLRVVESVSDKIKKSQEKIEDRHVVALKNLFDILPSYLDVSIESFPNQQYGLGAINGMTNSCESRKAELEEKLSELIEGYHNCVNNPTRYSLFDRLSFSQRNLELIQQKIIDLETHINVLEELGNKYS